MREPLDDRLEAGLLSVVSCPVCAQNLRDSLHRKEFLFGGEPWKALPCPDHPGADWGDASRRTA